MALISHIRIDKGSLIDEVSGLQATKTGTNGKFKTSSKGLVFDKTVISDRLTNGVLFPINGAEWSISIPFMLTKINTGWNIICGFDDAGTNRFLIGYAQHSSGLEFYSYNGTANVVTASSLSIQPKVNTPYLLTITYKNSTPLLEIYLNNVKETGTFAYGGTKLTTYSPMVLSFGSALGYNGITGWIGSPKIYNHALSAQERNKLYDEFLTSYPIAEDKINPYCIEANKSDKIREVGLVAAYNFIRGSVLDVSGNGRHGTKVSNPLPVKEGLKFDGVDDYITLPTITALDNNDGQFTICGTLTPKYLSANQTGIFNYGGTTRVSIINQLGYLMFCGFKAGVGYYGKRIPEILNSSFTFVMVMNNNVITAYVNGVLLTDTNAAIASAHGSLKTIGISSLSGLLKGMLEELKIYNVAKDASFARDYHNKFAKRPTIIETGKGEGVGTKPTVWQGIGTTAGVPNVVWDEFTTNDSVLKTIKKGVKYHKCNVAQLYSIPSKQAYGTWEFYLYKDNIARQPTICFIHSTKAGFTTASNYSILITGGSSGELRFYRDTNLLFLSSASYLSLATLYKFRITRTTDGIFKIYVLGGTFTTWTLVTTQTDNTHKTSNYINVVLSGIGDRFLLPPENDSQCSQGIII